MQRLEVNCAVRPIYGSLGAKGLREEHALKVCKNRVLREVFGPAEGEVT
jgi:hypothetical protein